MAWPRAIALGAVVAVSATAAHAVVGGHSHGGVGLALAILLSVPAARLLLARPASAMRTVAYLVAAQLVAHLAATPLGHVAHSHTAAMQVTHDHGTGLRRSVAPLAPVIAEWLGAGLSDFVVRPQMLVAHLLAAALAAAWLARGERWALTTLRLLWTGVVAATPAQLVPMPRTSAPVSPGPHVPATLSRYRVRVLARRGPPAGLWTSMAV